MLHLARTANKNDSTSSLGARKIELRRTGKSSRKRKEPTPEIRTEGGGGGAYY